MRQLLKDQPYVSLGYHDGYLKIPNQELMKEFEKALKDKSFGEVAKIVENSKKLLKATVNGDESTVIDLVHNIHNSEIPILQYNDENSLASVISLPFLNARDFYRFVMIFKKEHICKIKELK